MVQAIIVKVISIRRILLQLIALIDLHRFQESNSKLLTFTNLVEHLGRMTVHESLIMRSSFINSS